MKCQKAKDYKETKMNIENVSLKEQECHIWLDRIDNICHIDSSWQKYVLRLLNNPFFVLQHATIGLLGNLIQIKGTLPLKAITIRKKGIKTAKKEVNKYDTNKLERN